MVQEVRDQHDGVSRAEIDVEGAARKTREAIGDARRCGVLRRHLEDGGPVERAAGASPSSATPS
jgi:hypothetical protein